MFYTNEPNKASVSVQDLVYIVCRKRERFNRFDNALKDDPAFAISVAKREAEMSGAVYHPDVNLSCCIKICDVPVEISGKISVLIKDGKYLVDAVKSVRYPLKFADETFSSLWINEAKFLAYILAKKHSLDSVEVRVSVFHTETLERRNHIFTYSFKDLLSFYNDTATAFSRYFNILHSHVTERNSSAQSAGFPFEKARDGQKEISREVYSAIKNRHNAIINAPTGLGKTSATLYPALKAQSKGLSNKIFYLTAKGSGSRSVADAVKSFSDVGYHINVSFITAKSKICSKRPCSPKSCQYPDGHHDRMMSAVLDIISNYSNYAPEIVTDYSTKYKVCPFMLETELAWFADLIVCDYNYVFDPDVSVKLSPCFSGNDVILVDEAHNLIDRLRGIYSAEIDIAALKSLSDSSVSKELKSSLAGFLDFVKSDAEDSGETCESMSSRSLDGFERHINELLSSFQENFEGSGDLAADVAKLSDSLRIFTQLLTKRSDSYLTFYNDKGNPEIFMVNTSDAIAEISHRLGSIILFSATLFPEEYYKYMLGARKKDTYVAFPSPFDSKNLIVIGYPISTKYSDREATVEDVVRAIWTAGRCRCGNYIAFFPSYQYMALALNTFIRLFPDETVIYQKPNMTEEERGGFIAAFNEAPRTSLFAFAVLGGAFSEGIDLVGDKLSGAAVVGLGSLPPSKKSALISSYFGDLFFDGDKFAYHYPGLNKVFQAGGRVIRSESDKGYLLIIDDRFFAEENIELLPENWSNVKRAKDNNEINAYISDFWQK